MNTKKLALFGAILLAAASTMADLRSETQKRLNRYCVAVKRRDASGIERELRDIFAPDFKFIPKKGKSMGLSRWIADEKMMVSMTQSVKSVSLHIDSVKMGKGTATMQVTLNYEGITKMDPKGQFGLLKYVATSDQTMVRKRGRWWITEMREGSSKTSFNGKPVAM